MSFFIYNTPPFGFLLKISKNYPLVPPFGFFSPAFSRKRLGILILKFSSEVIDFSAVQINLRED
jgi:hypothetical protein